MEFCWEPSGCDGKWLLLRAKGFPGRRIAAGSVGCRFRQVAARQSRRGMLGTVGVMRCDYRASEGPLEEKDRGGQCWMQVPRGSGQAVPKRDAGYRRCDAM